MSSEKTRVVYTLSGDKFVYHDPDSNDLTGVCVDLWQKTASDLNLTYSLTVRNRTDMIADLEKNRWDVVMGRVDPAYLNLEYLDLDK